MGDRFPWLLAGALALALVLGLVLVQGSRRGAFADRFSTYRSDGEGTRALYLLLEAQGEGPQRWQKSLEELPARTPLAMLGVSVGDGFSLLQPDGGQELSRLLDLAQEEVADADRLLGHLGAGGTLLYAPTGTGKNRLLDALDVSLEPTVDAREVRTLLPAQPGPFTRGVERVRTPVPATLRLPAGAVTLLVEEEAGAPVVALLEHGPGRVVVVAAPELFTNRHLGQADNARLALALARGLGGGRGLAFDELHHGFGTGRSLGDFAARYGLDLALAQLVLGLAAWALALRRLGAVRPPTLQLRVSATDALMALSRIYREGRHHGHAAAALVQGLCADLAPRAGVAPSSTPAEVAAALQARGRPALARSLLEVAARAASVRTDGELLALARLAAVSRRLQHPASP